MTRKDAIAVQIRGADGKWLDPVMLVPGEISTIRQPFDFSVPQLSFHGVAEFEVRLVRVEGAGR